MIGGIDTPTSGQVIFEGRDVATFKDKQLTEYRRTRVGFVFQFYNLVASLTAKENVEVSTEVVDNPMDPEDALNKVGLGDRIDHFPAQMSGGQQQRVAIARALAKNPRLMLCDEPTGALDHDTSILVLNLLKKLNRDLGTTIIMITHAPPIAEMAHRVVHIGSGKVMEIKENKNPKIAEELDW
jgi:putative ABC transport system ATP-binding protein